MLTIRRVDPDDTEAMTVYAELSIESEMFENPHSTPFTLEEQREELRNKVSSVIVEGYLGVAADVPVATGTVELFMADNTEKAWVFANTRPERRRQGFGSTMLDFLVERARAEQRTTLITAAEYPFEADESHPYRQFLIGRGFTFSQQEVHRVLELPADNDTLDRLEAEAAAHHRDYTFADYEGLPPESMREDYCILLNHIMVDAPSGTVDFEEGRTTPDVLVQREKMSQAAGRTTYITVALDRAGVPVAHNVLQVPATDADKIFNQDTLVRRDHRGHRLGFATKIRNLRRVFALHPDRTAVHTWNAETNSAMVAINDAIGFRAVTVGGEYVRTF